MKACYKLFDMSLIKIPDHKYEAGGMSELLTKLGPNKIISIVKIFENTLMVWYWGEDSESSDYWD